MKAVKKPHSPGEPLPFQDLVHLLEVEDFDSRVERLLAELDAARTPIDCRFPRSGRPAATRPSRSLLGQYRSEVQRIPLMNRSEEVRFCMGVEFLWRRLRKVREEAGFCPDLLNHHPGLGGGEFGKCGQGRVPGPGGFGCVSADLEPGIRTRLQFRTEEFLAARNELIERNLHIVFRLLERYRGVGVPKEDMIQEANQNLFKAVEGFDFTRGVRFKTYAGFWVNQAFLNAIYNQSRTVRVPAYIGGSGAGGPGRHLPGIGHSHRAGGNRHQREPLHALPGQGFRRRGRHPCSRPASRSGSRPRLLLHGGGFPSCITSVGSRRS
ncbi:MAG: sigma factor, partial [Planctomycetota bacterium]